MSRHHKSSLAIAVFGVSLRGQILAREAISAHPGVRIAVRNLLFAEPMSISPMEARQAVATGVAATESLRNGSEPRMVTPLEPYLWAHFHQEFQTRGTEVSANAS